MAVLKVILDKITVETHNTKTYCLRYKDPHAVFEFKPGQFVMLAIPCVKDGKEQIVRRAYSIASPPTQKESIDLTMKKEGLVTTKMDCLNGGEELEVSGPYGTFVFQEAMSNNVMFLASGAGIAPIWGIMKFIRDKKLDVKMTLVFSNMTPHDIIYKNELPQLINEAKDLVIALTITRPNESSIQELEAWTGRKGRIDKNLIKEFMDLRTPDLFYVCGSPDMVNACMQHLKDLGVSPVRIRTERF